jgi:hypothetical protein
MRIGGALSMLLMWRGHGRDARNVMDFHAKMSIFERNRQGKSDANCDVVGAAQLIDGDDVFLRRAGRLRGLG